MIKENYCINRKNDGVIESRMYMQIFSKRHIKMIWEVAQKDKIGGLE